MVKNSPRQDLTLQHFPARITQVWIQQHPTRQRPIPGAWCISRFLRSTQEGVSQSGGVRTSVVALSPAMASASFAPLKRRYQKIPGSGLHSPVLSTRKQLGTDSLNITGINEAVTWAGTRGITSEQMKAVLELSTAEVFILCISSKNKPDLLTQVDK